MGLSYHDNTYRPPKQFKRMPLYGVRSVCQKNKKAPFRVLFVLDHISTEDLAAKKLFHDSNGERFFLLCNLAKQYYNSEFGEEDLDWMAVPFNQFKTYGKELDSIRADANESFAKHLRKTVLDYKPTVIVMFGKQPFQSMCSSALMRTKGNFTNYLGTSVETTFSYKDKEHTCTVVPTLSLNSLFGKAKESIYLSGYVARNLVTAFEQGKMRYKIPDLYKLSKKGAYKPFYETHYITELKEVRKLLKYMSKQKYVSIDTETQNLYRINNKIQTVQFACDLSEAYIIPIYHKDSPFTGSELLQISDMLREYFEQTNNNKCQIYTNAKFDLNVMRTNFNIRYYKAPVWDVCAGEFALDENMKLLHTVTGSGYYNLGNLAVQYGCFAFYDNPFGKENRAFIADNPLSEPVLQYCSLDVLIPLAIFFKQKKRAKDIKYDKYVKMVRDMVGNQIHSFSILETTGALCDIDYLFSLKMPDSPINKIIDEKEVKILSSAAVAKANKVISAGRSVPQSGLYGSVNIKHFDLSQSEHKQILFFDVLGLKPVEEGKKIRKNGLQEGKIDKAFQKKYADNEVVAAYTDLQKAYKIRNAYVNSFITKYSEDLDFKTTFRMRPTYSYQDVVTGRTSASDPNLQQIPSRGALSKYIKRLLISRPGSLLIKVDYSAHEVRGWSIISGDKAVADVFDVGKQLRDRFKAVPDPWIAQRIKLEGDVHKINAAYFFGLPIEQITDSIRNAVKTVIFGLIYQQGDEGLANSTGRSVKEIGKIKGQFLDRFPVGLKWFDVVKNSARDNYYVESPVGRRRTLWPLMFESHLKQITSMSMLDKQIRSVINKCLRQSVNSPVQGFGSDLMMLAIRLIDKYKYDYFLKTGVYPQMNLNVSVHDSLTVEVDYEWFWLAVQFIEHAMTVGCKEFVEKTYGYHIMSAPEIDIEVGATERDVKKWSGSYTDMEPLIRATLKTQKEELGYDVNEEKITKLIMRKQYQLMPEWLQKQLWANDIEIPGMKKNPLTKQEMKLISQYHKEKPKNLKSLAEYKEDLARREREAEEKASKSSKIEKAKKAALAAR